MKKTKRVTKVAKEKLVTINEVTYKEIVNKIIDDNFFKFWVEPNIIKADKIKLTSLNLINYLVYYMSNKNTVLVKINELAKKFNVTRQTISKKLKELENDHYIKIETNVILVNPHYYYKGTAKSRELAFNIYYNFNTYKKRKELKKEYIKIFGEEKSENE